LGALPALLLRPAVVDPSHSRTYPRGAFISSFLGAILIWNFATGMVNPFLSAYFVRIAGLSTPQIGVLFSFGQAAQVAAVLAAPIVLKKLGVIPAIVVMQVATAVCALTFALQPTVWLRRKSFSARPIGKRPRRCLNWRKAAKSVAVSRSGWFLLASAARKASCASVRH